MVTCPVYEPPPPWLPVASNTVLAITIPASIYTFYLIIVVTPPHTDKEFKIYFLIYHVLTTSFSMLNELLSVVHYMPSLIIAQMGWLGSKSFFLFGLNIGGQGLVGAIGLIVLIQRFSIILYGERKKNVFRSIFFCISLVNIIIPSIIVCYFTATYDERVAAKHLMKDCPLFLPLLSYEYLYLDHPRMVDVMAFTLIFFPMFNATWFVCILAFCLKKFKEKTKFFSDSTRKVQTRLLINLALTISIPLVAHAVPAGIASVLIQRDSIQLWMSVTIWYMSSIHAVLNCIASILLNEYYFRKFKKDLQFVFCSAVKKLCFASKVSNDISFVL